MKYNTISSSFIHSSSFNVNIEKFFKYNFTLKYTYFSKFSSTSLNLFITQIDFKSSKSKVILNDWTSFFFIYKHILVLYIEKTNAMFS